MRTYQSHRLRLTAERALHQVQRGRLPQCPRCAHSVIVHGLDESGQRVCTRGEGLLSCRDCAHDQALMPDLVRAVFLWGQVWQLAPRPESWLPLVLQ